MKKDTRMRVSAGIGKMLATIIGVMVICLVLAFIRGCMLFLFGDRSIAVLNILRIAAWCVFYFFSIASFFVIQFNWSKGNSWRSKL